jgi:hypothetical protein
LYDGSPRAEGRSEPVKSEVLRRQPFRGEETFDIGRIADDGQPVAVTDQLNLVIDSSAPDVRAG